MRSPVATRRDQRLEPAKTDSTHASIPLAKADPMPDFVTPIVPVLRKDIPAGPNWLHEIKYDGYRMQARIEKGSVRMLSRNGLDWTARFGPIVKALQDLKVDSAIIDGEVIVQDDKGISSFSGLQADLKSGRKDRLGYFVFDLMFLDGFDLQPVALHDRKARLWDLMVTLPTDRRVRYSDHVADGEFLFHQACEIGLEGIVSKHRDRPYTTTRNCWFKSKCALRAEFVVLGYVPSTTLKGAIGALVLGREVDAQLVYVGRVGTGFSGRLAVELRDLLSMIEGPRPLFVRSVPGSLQKAISWVLPKVNAEVHHRGWTSDGLLRQASFKGITAKLETQ